ncbi:hypothetical protein DVT68_17870 [Dyella solisilvae]|uniref:Uncharacterized protein n=2 Tax=Dyella solisilvae TaxID=1920168 RepID=A0A370K3I0_9GAMM|nr:hypothetical protein DVT68_17870 [Dyella solisilvae]
MADWPAWGRSAALLLAYALLAGGVWLMAVGGAAARFAGVLAVALSLPLLVHAGRAVARERSRASDRRYLREFMPAIVGYMLFMLYVWPLQKGMDPGWLKTALVLSPMLPVAGIIRASLRHVLASDERERRQHMEALAIGVVIVSLGSCALGFLGAARILVLDGATVLLFVYPAICITYGLACCFLTWRSYRA